MTLRQLLKLRKEAKKVQKEVIDYYLANGNTVEQANEWTRDYQSTISQLSREIARKEFETAKAVKY